MDRGPSRGREVCPSLLVNCGARLQREIACEPDRDRVHYLNGTAAVVFLFCDGTHDAEDIAGLVAKAYDLDDAPSDEVTELSCGDRPHAGGYMS